MLKAGIPLPGIALAAPALKTLTAAIASVITLAKSQTLLEARLVGLAVAAFLGLIKQLRVAPVHHAGEHVLDVVDGFEGAVQDRLDPLAGKLEVFDEQVAIHAVERFWMLFRHEQILRESGIKSNG
jgi:hypothetical protein